MNHKVFNHHIGKKEDAEKTMGVNPRMRYPAPIKEEDPANYFENAWARANNAETFNLGIMEIDRLLFQLEHVDLDIDRISLWRKRRAFLVRLGGHYA